jgi:hypothetical protein
MRTPPIEYPSARRSRPSAAVALLAVALLAVAGRPAVADEPAAPAAVGQTRVARWQDDRAACFLLMFDDGWPSGRSRPRNWSSGG